MKHLSTSTTNRFAGYARRGALLLALGAAGPAAWGQSLGPVSLYTTGSINHAYAVAVGDVNGDGRPDVVAACPGPGNGAAVVLPGQAGGGLGAAVTYAAGSGSQPVAIALGDVNADGRPDMVTANYGTNAVGLFLGQANGFAAMSAYPLLGGSMPQGVVLRDVNGDGRVDVATANAGSTVSVLLGQQSGFATAASYAAGSASGPQSVAVGDLNGDGRLDLVTANAGSGTAGVLLGQAGGSFALSNTYSTGGSGSQPYAAALSDVNGDGRPDIIAANYFTNDVAVLVQQGSGFAPVVSYAVGSGTRPQSLALGDVNGDGRTDIVTANYGTGTVSVMPGQAGGGFAAPTTFAISPNSNPSGIALGDVNGDGRLDIVTANTGSSTIGVLLNTGTYTPLATARPTAPDVALSPNPAHDAFTVTLPAGTQATQGTLLNALGQVVATQSAPATAQGSRLSFQTTGLAAGVYTLRLLVGNATLAKRVVLQ